MSELLEPLFAAWWRWIAPLSFQGGLLLLAVAVIDRLLPPRTWPQLRACLWMLALLKLVLPPSLTSPFSLSRWLGLDLAEGDPLPAVANAEPGTMLRWAQGLVLLWLAGALLLTVAGFFRSWRLHRGWRRQGNEPPGWLLELLATTATQLGLGRAPRALLLPGLAAPFVVGIRRPLVLLPSDIRRQEARYALLHELAHLKRRDHWLAALVLAVQVLYWFHPMVWWARRRLAALIEQCCDRTVTRALDGEAGGYRRALLYFAARRFELPATGLGFVVPRSPLLARLALLEHAKAERLWLARLVTALAAALMLVTCLPMAATAEESIETVAELIERPPGCLPLRYLVLRRLAEEEGYTIPSSPADPEEATTTSEER